MLSMTASYATGRQDRHSRENKNFDDLDDCDDQMETRLYTSHKPPPPQLGQSNKPYELR